MENVLNKIDNFLTESTGPKLDSKEIHILQPIINKAIDDMVDEIASQKIYDILSHERNGQQISAILDSLKEHFKGAVVDSLRSVKLD
jgi:hypothetical protein